MSEPVALRNLTFNDDGTIDPAQLEGLPADFVERVTSPAFIEEARKRIHLQKAKDRLQREMDRRARKTGRRESKRTWVYKEVDEQIVRPDRRPPEMSGRQRKRGRRLMRRALKEEALKLRGATLSA